MKGRAAAQPVEGSPARVKFKVRFSEKKGKGRRPTRIRAAEEAESPATAVSGETEARKVPEVDPAKVPKLTRLLVLGHHFERLVRDGVVKDYAEIARLTGMSRARVSQLLDLALLSPEEQERILLFDLHRDQPLSGERVLRNQNNPLPWRRRRETGHIG